MSLERLGIVEEAQQRRETYARFAYRAPVNACKVHHISIDLPSNRRTVTRLDIPPVRPRPVFRPPLPRPPRRSARLSARLRAGINAIIDACAKAFHVSVGELLSRAKPNWIARPRFAVVRLLRSKLRLSFPVIGQIIGRDHTSVLAAYRRCRELRAKDSDYRNHYSTAAHLVRHGSSQ